MNNIPIDQSIMIDVDQVIDISSASITNVLSFTMSLTKKFSVVATENGFCLVNNAKKSFKRFENQRNPFKKEAQTGVEMGTALQQRSQVAIIPTRTSKSYSRTTVYIYDYQLQTILYSNPFHQPIRQLTLTDDTIIVSNNKRIIIYNYSNDIQPKTQEYYLRMYVSKDPNHSIKYLEMGCQEKIGNNSIEEVDEGGQVQGMYRGCLCGKYVMSWVKPYKLVYAKVFSINGVKNIQLSMYDWAYDREKILQYFPYNEPFSFNISEDGSFLAYSYNQGKNYHIVKLDQKGIYCTVSVSSSIKACIGQGFFSYDGTLWFTVLRKQEKGQNSSGNMHFFKVVKKKQQKEIIYSRYSRYFSLFKKTMSDYGICQGLVGPEFYVLNGAVYASSVCGAVVEVIDIKLSSNHDKKTSENLLKWKQQYV